MCCSVALLSACARVEGHADVPVRPVRVTRATAAPTSAPLRFSATIRADREVTVTFKTNGYVATIPQRTGADGRSRPLQAGDVVAAGTMLARLREDDYRERVAQAHGAIGEITAAREKAALDLSRAQALFEGRSLTKPELDAAQAAFDAASAQLASARAGAELAAIAMGDAAITAPIAGVITARKIETGAFVQPGAAAFTIARIDPVTAVIGVPDLHLDQFPEGRTVRVTSDAFPGRAFAGMVTSIAPMAEEQSRLFAVEVALSNDSREWRPGMIAAIELATSVAPASAPGADLAVPLSAVVRSGGNGGYGVFVVGESSAGATAKARPVELGDVRGNLVVVKQGLRRDETIVTSGPGLLVDGERIRIIP
jgi:RND family efflux transporter MFP subunit